MFAEHPLVGDIEQLMSSQEMALLNEGSDT